MTHFPSTLAASLTDISPMFALLALVLALAVFVCLIMAKLRQSLLVGYFLCGIIIANSGAMEKLGLERGGATIAGFAELGVVLLMFTLGIEFSLREVKHLWRFAFIGGGLQVAFTSAIAFLIASCFAYPITQALMIAVIVALSSTAVALQSFQDMGMGSSPGAKTALGIALFQDIFVIALFIIMPSFMSQEKGGSPSVALAMGKGAAFLLVAALLGRYGINPLLHAVAKTRSRELFTLAVIGTSAGITFAAGTLDLSLALGAFAAGMMVSESIYSHRIMQNILPFKDLFLTIFFVSVGLMIDLHAFALHWPWVLTLAALVFFTKFSIVFVISRLLRLPLRPTLYAAASLSSIGEFSLVLMQKFHQWAPLDPRTEQVILLCTAIGMGIIPATMKAMNPVGTQLERWKIFRRHSIAPETLTSTHALKELDDHAIICGYGPVGQALHSSLTAIGIPCLIVDLNAETVRSLKNAGHPVLFGDITHPEALALTKIRTARLIAYTFPIVAVTRQSIPLVLQENPHIAIFARAKFSLEALELTLMGARVIHDEHEAAAALCTVVETAYENLHRPATS
jgi:CPA2 family monovalent cation:H+ antiporter-2